jgi:hypothetical protein
MDPLKMTFDIDLKDKGTYTFRIPKITFDVEVGYKAAEIRRRIYPEGQGVLVGLEDAAYAFSRYGAYLELYLASATEDWPFTKDAQNKPVVDVTKIEDPLKAPLIYEVGVAFDAAHGRFRSGGNFDNPSAIPETMAG